MNNLCIKNIKEEIEKLNSLSNDEYYIYPKLPNESCPLILEIKGNVNSPYEGGVFFIEINNNEIKFITKICSIFINIYTGEFLDKQLIKNKNSLISLINFIKEEILVSPNDTKLIEKEIEKWPGRETYFKYLEKIKSCTQQYANKDGKKIKVDSNLLSNLNFSEYENRKKVEYKNEKQINPRIKREINDEIENISFAKKFFDIKIENIYFCPFNNFKNMYFEFLGEPGTPYEGGVFQFLYEIPEDYPFRPGKCVFRTKIFHNKFAENSSNICEYEMGTNFSPSWSIYLLCLYYYKMVNKYDYICCNNKKARNLMFTNFKEYLKEVKIYVKKYANLEGIKLIPDLNLIESSSDKLIIEPPIEPDFMPVIASKDFDKNIEEEEINIIAKSFYTSDIMLKILNTEFVIDICMKIRNYFINNKKIKKGPLFRDSIGDYKNLLPKILNPKQKGYMEFNKQIGSYGIKNNDKIRFSFQIPTCSFDIKKENS